jgi:hypothetical protein
MTIGSRQGDIPRLILIETVAALPDRGLIGYLPTRTASQLDPAAALTSQ